MSGLERMKQTLVELFKKAQREKSKEKQRELYENYQRLYRAYQVQRIICQG